MSASPSADVISGTAIRAAVTTAPGAGFAITAATLAERQGDELLVRLEATGICHTDLIAMTGRFPLTLPYVLGHEGVGIVVACGRAGPPVGARVVLTFDSCGQCGRCGEGHPAYCTHYDARNYTRTRADGTPFITTGDGCAIGGRFFGQSSFATHVLASSRNAVPIAADVPLAALSGMGCGFLTGAGAVETLGTPPVGATLAILGAGPVGFAALFMARERGWARIVVVDRIAARLDLARALGADATIDGGQGALAGRLAALGGIDAAIDTTGAGPVVAAVAPALARSGTLVLLGASADRIAAIDVVALLRGRTIRGEMFGDADPHALIPRLVALHTAGRFPVDRIVTCYPFERIGDAVAALGDGTAIKALLTF